MAQVGRGLFCLGLIFVGYSCGVGFFWLYVSSCHLGLFLLAQGCVPGDMGLSHANNLSRKWVKGWLHLALPRLCFSRRGASCPGSPFLDWKMLITMLLLDFLLILFNFAHYLVLVQKRKSIRRSEFFKIIIFNVPWGLLFELPPLNLVVLLLQEPVKVSGLPKEIIKIYAGYHHSSAVTGSYFLLDASSITV